MTLREACFGRWRSCISPLYQVLFVLSVASCFTAASGWQYDSLVDVPLGCFNFGYQYTPEMANVTGQPFLTDSPMTCQAKCKDTPGCVRFGYWSTGNQCWLGGAKSTIVISNTLGSISGPSDCEQESFTCDDSNLPGTGFPGRTVEESHKAWTTGQQPTNLQCWPRKANGFPASCPSDMATVLEDTLKGWPGKCEGLMKIENLSPQETCQSRCFGSPLCGVWAEENSTSGDGTMSCWQGLFGRNCYDNGNGLNPAPGSHFRAQRIMHGTFRVLMNTASMQLTNLTKAFGVEMHPDPQKGEEACKLTCLSYLLCQFWQYSDVYGCWVEDDMTTSLSYPLVNDGTMMNTGSYSAQTVKSGQYIRHLCKPGGPTRPLPTDPPIGQIATMPPTAAPPSPAIPGEFDHIEVAEKEPMPLWATILIALTLSLCLGVIGAALWMTMLDADKMGSRGSREYGVFDDMKVGMGLRSDAGSREVSYESQAAPLVNQGNGGWGNGWGNGIGHSLPHLHFGNHGHHGHNQFPRPYDPQQSYGQQQHPGAYDPRYAGVTMPPTRDALMQYAHQGYRG